MIGPLNVHTSLSFKHQWFYLNHPHKMQLQDGKWFFCVSLGEKLLQLLGFWMEGVGQTSIAITGILCNIFLVVILFDKDMRNSFNFMLIALSICDSWYLLGSILESFRKSFNLMSKAHTYLFPHFLFPGQMIAMTSSVYLTVAISVERFAAVHYPLNYHQVCQRTSLLLEKS